MQGDGDCTLYTLRIITPVAPNRIFTAEEHVSVLSWAPIIPIDLQFFVDTSHAYYRLYREAFEAFKVEFPLSTLKDDCYESVEGRPLGEWPPSFAKLVNLLAYKYCLQDADAGETIEYKPTLDCVLSFIISGMLFFATMDRSLSRHKQRFNLASSVRNRSGRIYLIGSNTMYATAFLYTLTVLWREESTLRRNAKWSPMPWVLEPQYGRDTPPVDLDTDNFASLAIQPVLEEDRFLFEILRSHFGNPVDIPWFGAAHDGYPFCPTLNGYTDLRQEDKATTAYDDVGLWVGAMTFGLLEALFGIKIPEARLLSPSSHAGPEVLEGKRIFELIFKWFMYWKDQECTSTYFNKGKNVAKLLSRALAAVDEEGRKGLSVGLRAGFHPDKVQGVICAVALLITILSNVASSLWASLPEIEDLGRQIDDPSRYSSFIITVSCERRLISMGWCPNTVSEDFLFTLTKAALSGLLRLRPFTKELAEGHRECTKDICRFHTIANTGSYEVSHVDPSCSCGAAGRTRPPDGAIEQVLSSGDIPVVRYNGKQLTVHRAADTPYVAFSHVWAEGLGSMTEAGLPTCQVRRLALLAAALLPETGGAFWLDSLCVPYNKPSRRQAIQLMADTYRLADKVVVLDQSIRTLCTREQPWEMNILRIATSAWVRRVWTLQEGLLARTLVFEFADGLVDADKDLIGDVYFFRSYYVTFLPLFTARVSLRSKKPWWHQDDRKRGQRQTQLTHAYEFTLDDIIMLLRCRTTSHPEDETITIASLLPSIDLGALLDIQGPDAAPLRLKEFFCQLGEVPRRFPLLPCPKLGLPGFRWAPRALTTAMESAHGRFGSAQCGESGLRAKYSVGCLRTPISIPTSFMEEVDRDSDQWQFNLVHEATASTYQIRIFFNCILPTAARELNAIDAFLFIDSEPPQDASVSLLAAVLRRSGGTGDGHTTPLECTFVAPGQLTRLTYRPTEALARGCPPMEELETMDVLLT